MPYNSLRPIFGELSNMKIFSEPSNKFEYDSQTEKQDSATNTQKATEIEPFFFVNHLK